MPLKKGPFHLALSLEYDIVIVIIVGSSRIWGPSQLLPQKGTIFVKFLKRIPYEEISHMDHNQLRELVEKRTREEYFNKSDE